MANLFAYSKPKLLPGTHFNACRLLFAAPRGSAQAAAVLTVCRAEKKDLM